MNPKITIELDSKSLEKAKDDIISLHVHINNMMATIGKSRLLRWIFGIEKTPDYIIDPADWRIVGSNEANDG